MPTPRAKWWTARSTIDEPDGPIWKGRFKNLCDLLCERYWRDGRDPAELVHQVLDLNAIRRVVESQDKPARCTNLLVELVKRVQGWRDVGALEVRPNMDGNQHKGCTLEWPNAPEYLGIVDRRRGPLPPLRPAPSRAPQNQTRQDMTSSVLEDAGADSGSDAPASPPELDTSSRRTILRWLLQRGYRVSDHIVERLFERRVECWSGEAPASWGGATMDWLKRQHRDRSLAALVAECGGGSLRAELQELMADIESSAELKDGALREEDG